MHWQPTASLGMLQKRSQGLQQLRAFFYARNLLEVDTPILSQAGTPDVHLRSLNTQVRLPGLKNSQTYYLHTSPEYAMKRLLCAGSGDIFYLGKVFRDGDFSQRHQVEFTMLEWYRLEFDLMQMMQETAELIQQCLPTFKIEMLTYQQAFERFAGIPNIFSASASDCQQCLEHHHVPKVIGVDRNDKALWEQLVLTEVIEHQLGQGKITCLYHYPARDAALAKIHPERSHLAQRFEVFVSGMELANGYEELQDANTYRERFEQSNVVRQKSRLPKMPLDEHLLSALKSNQFPACSGVALGVDRLFMLMFSMQQLTDVMPFSIANT